MFSKSLDSKSKYYIDDTTEVVDLTESIFDPNKAVTQIGTMYRVSKEFEMRPDLISKAIYGSTDYTEMVLKYSFIDNPFAVQVNDPIYGASLSYIYNPVKDTETENTKVFNAVKNYHKYIDKSKVPDKAGSDSVNNIPSTSPTEANISKTGTSGLTVRNGKIYFGAIDETLTAVDSSIVDCATNGTTLGEFLNAAIRNNGI